MEAPSTMTTFNQENVEDHYEIGDELGRYGTVFPCLKNKTNGLYNFGVKSFLCVGFMENHSSYCLWI